MRRNLTLLPALPIALFIILNAHRTIDQYVISLNEPPILIAHYGWPFETYNVSPPPPEFEFWEVLPNSSEGYTAFALNLAVLSAAVLLTFLILYLDFMSQAYERRKTE